MPHLTLLGLSLSSPVRIDSFKLPTYNFPSSEIDFERIRKDWVMGIARLSMGQPQAKERLGQSWRISPPPARLLVGQC